MITNGERKMNKIKIYNDNFQNYKKYGIPKAQLVIADIPYNVGNNFYGSNPMWYKGGDNKNGESEKAGKAAFNTDFNFNIAEYFHFCNKLLKKEPEKAGVRGRSSDAPCMIIFCAFEQIEMVKFYAQKPVKLLKKLIETFTDEGDVVIDPCAGSGSTLRAAAELNRSAYGFEIYKNFYTRALEEMLSFEKIEDKQINFDNSIKEVARYDNV